jgi:hypothetical protein
VLAGFKLSHIYENIEAKKLTAKCVCCFKGMEQRKKLVQIQGKFISVRIVVFSSIKFLKKYCPVFCLCRTFTEILTSLW